MKKDSITIPYDEEKLATLRLYLEQKGQSIEQEKQNIQPIPESYDLCLPYLKGRIFFAPPL